MSRLADLQRGFRDYVLYGEPEGIRPLVDAAADPMRRLGIYGAAYRLRLKEALATDYTLLAGYLGGARFDELMEDYIRRHPSRHYNIRRFGHRMAEYLTEAAPWSGMPVLSEMAAFEWAQGLSFDAPDAETVGVETVAGLPAAQWATLRVVFHPSVQRRDFRFDVHTLWSALQAGEPLPVPQRQPAAIPWLFWRQDRRNVFTSLAPDQAAALDTAMEGGDFAAVCEALLAWHGPDAVPREAAGALKGWLEAGLVAGIRQ